MNTIFRLIFLTTMAAGLGAACCSAQPIVPRMTKYAIAETGCFAYLPSDPGEFQMSYSEDNSEVYTGEATDGEYFFAIILVHFSEPIDDDADAKNGMIAAYLDFLQSQFDITESAGYGYGHELESAPSAVGVIDYWKDEEGTQYAVKSWCDSEYLSVMMLYGPEDYPIFNVQEMFLNGFRFPEK